MTTIAEATTAAGMGIMTPRMVVTAGRIVGSVVDTAAGQ
jgi:hypothetical protein